MRKMIFLISLLMLSFLLPSCKSPTTPDNPKEPVQYWAKIEVIYDRDSAKITNPRGNDKFTCIRYNLFDPDPKIKSEHDSYIDGYYRVGVIGMEKLAENKFRGYLEQVFVQTESWHRKHIIWIQDPKFYDGFSDVSTYTPYGITIEKAYDFHILGYLLHFKVSKQ